MIAVVAHEKDHPVVQEFFELFKTPWEFYCGGRQCDVLICANGQFQESSAKLVLIYGGRELPFDRENEIQIHWQRRNVVITYKRERIPIYGECIGFGAGRDEILTEENTQAPAGLKLNSGRQASVRIGYDLFEEVRHLLTRGQPAKYAAIPTLEMHIALLRELIVTHSIPLAEIPPVPEGHDFIACLTHDVDHVAIRNHKCDHTMFGFLYRAVVGSVVRVCRGQMSARQLGINWAAAFSLPFVHLGWAKDFWCQFDRYMRIEEGLESTFFVIPYKNTPGRAVNGHTMPRRATQYDITDISDDISKLSRAGCEIGLHGIDAWIDPSSGKAELERVSETTGASEVGVRMHWLYFTDESPQILEKAGFSYDSTVGYNECIGYRAGTVQAFKPFGATSLLELPMHVMDTAMFYPSYMDLSPAEAGDAVNRLVDNAGRYGGVLTINWHDRSIAPERLWDDFYVKLLRQLKLKRAWFTTAGHAVAWFKERRSVVIESVDFENSNIRVKATMPAAEKELPRLKIRIYNLPGRRPGPGVDFVEVVFNGDKDETFAL